MMCGGGGVVVRGGGILLLLFFSFVTTRFEPIIPTHTNTGVPQDSSMREMDRRRKPHLPNYSRKSGTFSR